VERGNRTVKQKILAWQNDHGGSPFWSRSLLHVSLSINTSISYSTRKTPFDVVFRQSVNSSPWSITQAEHEEEEEVEADATDLPPGTDIARVEWSLDHSEFQGQGVEVGNSGDEEDITEGSQEHDDGSPTAPSVEGSVEEVGDLDEEDWEGFSDPSIDGVPSGDEDESSLSNTTSTHSKYHFNYFHSWGTTTGVNFFSPHHQA
jgi:hypothetical protein